jgi:Zn-dependent protease with chaperone function
VKSRLPWLCCKRTWRHWGLAALLACTSTAHAFFYDPFPNADSVKPSDELEERIWQEAETFRSQFARSRPSLPLAAAQTSVRAVLVRHWPALSPKLNLQVIDNADVLAVSSANGDLFISTGMLLRLDSEPELVAILAREITHIMDRHAVRTVYAARMGAGANVVFQAAVRANSFVSTLGLLSSFQVSPEMLLADGGKAFIQAQLGKLKENMADNLVRRMSATGFDAMVKTSLFGYTESLEVESDDHALAFLESDGIPTEVYARVMQRLLDEAQADETKFSAFYANAERLRYRLERVKAYEDERAVRLKKATGKVLLASASDVTPSEAPEPLSPSGQGGPTAPAVPAPTPTPTPEGSIELSATEGVASVVIADDDAAITGPDTSAASKPSASAQMVKSLTSSAAPIQALPYEVVPASLALPVMEAELDAGRLGRLIKSAERVREKVVLPERAKLLLAEACAAHPDPVTSARSEALTQAYLVLQPHDARALKLMGVLAFKRGQYAPAKSYLEQARQHAPNEEERGFINQYLQQVDKKLNAS